MSWALSALVAFAVTVLYVLVLGLCRVAAPQNAEERKLEDEAQVEALQQEWGKRGHVR